MADGGLKLKRNTPILINFVSAFKVHNKKGFRALKENRETSAFVIVLTGKIRFSANGQSMLATPNAPLYIPAGATYLNECLENAEAILLNFEELKPSQTMLTLSHLEEQTAIRIYERIVILKSRDTPAALAEIFSLLYDLVRNCYAESISSERLLISPALKYIDLHLGDCDLNVTRLADLCCISTVYFTRLFKKELHQTPYSYITRKRMETARDMLREACSISDIVHLVGYSDIYQFSRAFKKYYGVPPRTMKGCKL